jgi:pheromone receptor transcription factor
MLTNDQACLNAPEPASESNGVDGDGGASAVESPEEHAQMPQASMPRQPSNAQPSSMPQSYMTPEQQQQLQYQAYLQQQQPPSGYPGMPQQGIPRHPGHQ